MVPPVDDALPQNNPGSFLRATLRNGFVRAEARPYLCPRRFGCRDLQNARDRSTTYVSLLSQRTRPCRGYRSFDRVHDHHYRHRRIPTRNRSACTRKHSSAGRSHDGNLIHPPVSGICEQAQADRVNSCARDCIRLGSIRLCSPWRTGSREHSSTPCYSSLSLQQSRLSSISCSERPLVASRKKTSQQGFGQRQRLCKPTQESIRELKQLLAEGDEETQKELKLSSIEHSSRSEDLDALKASPTA